MTFPGREATVEFRRRSAGHRFGLKGPRAAQWLTARGIPVPAAPNTWISGETAHSGSGANAAESVNARTGASESAATAARGDYLLVARLGTGEFFLEDRADDGLLRDIDPELQAYRGGGSPLGDGPSGDSPSGDCPSGVYPVLRGDAAFLLSGEGSFDVLAQVCNVNFADLTLAQNPVIMTLMIGVSVLVIPQVVGGEPQFLIWCDPTFGAYLEESLEQVVRETVSDSGGHVQRQGSM